MWQKSCDDSARLQALQYQPNDVPYTKINARRRFGKRLGITRRSRSWWLRKRRFGRSAGNCKQKEKPLVVRCLSSVNILLTRCTVPLAILKFNRFFLTLLAHFRRAAKRDFKASRRRCDTGIGTLQSFDHYRRCVVLSRLCDCGQNQTLRRSQIDYRRFGFENQVVNGAIP